MKPAASDAPWPPSFQPRKPARKTGRRSSGREETISSDIRRSLVGASSGDRPPEPRDEADRPCEQHSRERHVDDNDAPRDGAVQAVLHLAERHLHEEDREEHAAAAREPREALAVPPRPAGERQEDDAEDGNGANVPVNRRVEVPEAAHDLRPRAAREATGGGRERP